MPGARVDARFTAATPDEWQSWQLPEEKGKPGRQIARMVGEWKELRDLLPLLKEVHSDPKIALGMAINAYQLLQKGVAPLPSGAATKPALSTAPSPFAQKLT